MSTAKRKYDLENMKLSIKTIINYVAVFIIFSNALSVSGRIGELRIAYLLIFLLLSLILPFIKDVNFNRGFIIIFSTLSVFSIYNIYLGNNTPILFVKQFFGIFTSAVFFYLLIKFNRYDTKQLFKIYLNIAYFVALIGIIQEISYSLKFKIGYDYSFFLPNWNISPSEIPFLLRVNSILPEPAHFCGVMMVAFFVSITSFTKYNPGLLSRWKSFVIILSFTFSFSSVGYIGAMFSILILAYNFNKIRYFFIAAMIVLSLFFFMRNYVGEFAARTDSTIAVLTGEGTIEESNLSTFAIMSNALVAYRSLQNNALIGTGLGSHELNYDKHIDIVIDTEKAKTVVNKEDAGSLFLRLVSETGLFGLLLFFVFIIKYYLRKNDDRSNYFWIINNAILCMFIIKLLRYGHYFADGFFFFFWLYYFSKIQSRKLLLNVNKRERYVVN